MARRGWLPRDGPCEPGNADLRGGPGQGVAVTGGGSAVMRSQDNLNREWTRIHANIGRDSGLNLDTTHSRSVAPEIQAPSSFKSNSVFAFIGVH